MRASSGCANGPVESPRPSGTASRCSITCSEASDEPAPLARRPHRQPRAGGRGHRPGHDRGGVPVLQREHRTAVRAHVRPEGQPAERVAAREGIRRAHRWRARRPGLQDRAQAPPGRHDLRPDHAQAGQGDRAPAGRLHRARAPALLARPQVPGGQPRRGQGRLQARRHHPDHPGPAQGRGDRRLLQHVRRQGTGRIAELARRLRHRSGRSWTGPEHRHRPAPSAPGRPRAGGQEPRQPADPNRALLQGPGRHIAARWPRWQRSRRRSS